MSFDWLYARHCSGCHGADGKLGPAPPLNDPLFLKIVPERVLLDVIRAGRPGTPMPSFAFLLIVPFA
jgi:mono/diheme cytochrome c family protein